MRPANDPVEYELTVMALQCRDLSSASHYPGLKEQLALLADDYEAALALLGGQAVALGDFPLAG